MQKYDVYSGLREIEISPERLGRLAQETASRAVRSGKSRFYAANLAAARADQRTLAATNNALEALGVGMELPMGAAEFMASFYMIERAAAEAEETARTLGALPLDAEGDRAAFPRVYSAAVDIAGRNAGRINGETLEKYIFEYQRVRPFTMREIAALPGILNIAIVRLITLDAQSILERARQYAAAEQAAQRLCSMPKQSPRRAAFTARLELADSPALAERLLTLLREKDEYALCQKISEQLALRGSDCEKLLTMDRSALLCCAERMANAIGSLHYLQTMDKAAFFEKHSAAEEILRQDEVYCAMDAESRRYYAARLEYTAKRCAAGETACACKALELAQKGEGKAAHIGYYLADPHGNVRLLGTLRPDKRFFAAGEGVRLAAALCTQGAIMLALLLCGAAGPLAAAAAIIPAWCIAREITLRIALKICPLRQIPRLAFDKGIPGSAATLVSIPVLITSKKDILAAIDKLEAHYIAAQDKNCRFAVLGDLKDSKAPRLAGEERLLVLARRATQRLNKKYSGADEDIFYFFIRKRSFSAANGAFMGHERKRGAVLALCALILDGQDAPFLLATGRPKANIKYCVTLDADTVLPQGELKKLVGAMEHPLNKPEQDENGIVRAGYGIIAPRMRQTLESACRSRFAALVSRCCGVDNYSALAGEYYQDVYGTGNFCGKGIFNVRCFYSALNGRFADDSILSHDILEGCILRAGFAHDITLYDEEPAAFLPWCKRQHRWIRGDWQLLPFIGVRVRDKQGNVRRNGLSALSRAKILANALNSLVPLAALLCFALMPCTNGGFYAALALAALCRAAFWQLLALAVRLMGTGGEKTDIRGALREAVPALIDGALALAALPYAALRTADAVLRTLWRLCITRKNLLQWQTAAQLGGAGGKDIDYYYAAMWPCVIWAAAMFGASFVGARLACLLLCAFSATAPAFIMYLDSPEEKPELSPANRQYILGVARDTWAFFEKFCQKEHGFLPPDNFQQHPNGCAVNNTSPTNIAMALTAAIAAQELGFIDAARLFEIAGGICAALEKLEKWHGHLFNWYSIITMQPLDPKYVSAVDSGNLAAALITAEQKLTALGAADIAQRFRQIYISMDFAALADDERKLLAIGCAAENGELSPGRYDLLASEARLAYFVAVALGQISPRYYYSLSRLLTAAYSRRVLLSWSGTMFEYLMPVIFTGMPKASALGESATNAVAVQRMAAREGMPWGESESGYYAFDNNMLYQYRAFGVRQLALCPNREDQCVIAPYASMLALMAEPNEAALNLARLEKMGARGNLGFYEALDMTAQRMPAGSSFKIIKSYMAHHQGMALCAAANALKAGCISRLFLGNAYVRATSTLLEERRADRGTAILRQKKRGARAAQQPCVPKLPRVSCGQFKVSESKLLTNGSYTVFVCDNGTGFSMRRKIDITRRTADGIRNADGVFVAISGEAVGFCATGAPLNGGAFRCTFEDHRVTHEREQCGIKTRVETYVDPARDAEIRLITVTNMTDKEKTLDIGAFAAMALSPYKEYAAHPAFVKLSIDAKLTRGGMLFERRSVNGEGIWAYAALRAADDAQDNAVYSSDALIMPGRGRSIVQAMRLGMMQQDVSCPVEPMLCARLKRKIAAHSAAKLMLIIGAEDTRAQAEAALEAAAAGAKDIAARAWAAANREKGIERISAGKAELFERIAARIILHIPHKSASCFAKAAAGADMLFKHGIDAGRPIIFMRVNSVSEIRLVKTLLEFMRYIALRGVEAEFVIIGGYPLEYQNALRDRLEGLIHSTWQQGVHLLNGFEIAPDEEAALEALALIIIDPRMSLDKQFTPQASGDNAAEWDIASSTPALHYPASGGMGSFDENGSYAFTLDPGQITPLPWANIIANDAFGTMVTETGGGYTWHGNSRLNKLTPWYNDPVNDPKGCILLIMDKENGQAWQAEAGALAHTQRTVRHGFGLTQFCGEENGIAMQLDIFVGPNEPARYALLTLENKRQTPAALRIFYGAELVLGEYENRHAVQTERIGNMLAARSLFDCGEDKAFIACIGAQCEFSDDREACLGGEWMGENGLKIKGGAQGFAALRADIDIACGQKQKLCLLLGQCSAAAAGKICAQSIEDAENKLAAVKANWQRRLNTISIKTPDARLDKLMNGRLLYQTLTARVMGKTGYYQCGGATGFRDQLQDMLALIYSEPQRVRQHICVCAAHQFAKGDAMHWWHEPYLGVRTNISDDKLFLPYVAAEYARITGDDTIWDECAPYAAGPELEKGRKDVYCQMGQDTLSESIYLHCVRAIGSCAELGAHGLPLIGGGDWNDGMNMIAPGGESVWLGMFLSHILKHFAPIARSRGDYERAAEYEKTAAALQKATEKEGWDGAWYRRAYLGSGEPLGSAQNAHCKIDMICQAWAGITGAAHADVALESALNALVDPRCGVAALLAPPFEAPDNSIGYITAYVPGVRENGGQYTHAAAWLIKAACSLGNKKAAHTLLRLINPIERTATQEGLLNYMAEPFVLAGDVYTFARQRGRAGWNWYTGAAAWLYKVTLEDVLGFKKEGDKLYISPCTEFEEYKIEYAYGSAKYIITVKKGAAAGQNDAITLRDDGKEHSFTLYRE